MNQKQYAAFTTNAKTLETLRRKKTNYVPGTFKVTKVIILSKEDFEQLSEDISPEYPFIKDNQELMSADPGGVFRCLLVRAKGETENLLIAQRKNDLYLGYGKDYHKIDLKDVPVEHVALEEPKVYQEHAVFYRKPNSFNDVNGKNPDAIPEYQTGFLVEEVIVLTDNQYEQFKKNGFLHDQRILAEHCDKMWFDMEKELWRCLLIKSENSKEGILVESEGFYYARYAAYIPDCDRLRLQEVPVHYEGPGKESEKKKAQRREEVR